MTAGDLDVLTDEFERSAPATRVEIELVFRRNGEPVEAEARAGILAVGGAIVCRSRLIGAGYHALLADIPAAALPAIILRLP